MLKESDTLARLVAALLRSDNPAKWKFVLWAAEADGQIGPKSKGVDAAG